MYSNQQPHSSNGNYQQDPNVSGHPTYNSGSSRHPTNYSRSSSVSSAVNYQQVSEGFDNGSVRQQHPYNQPSMYGTDIQYHYTTSPHTTSPPIPSYHDPEQQRSTSDGVTYTMGSRELDGTTAFRRTDHPGSSRPRTVSLSYAQQGEFARTSSADYHYLQDPRYGPQTHPYPPPSSYRTGAASPTIAAHSLSRTTPTRMNSTPLSHQDPSSHPSVYTQARRGSSASLTSGAQKPRNSPLDSAPGSSTSANQARPHVCDICGIAFVRGHDLKRHKDTHSNSKPHVCECGKSFSRKDALKRHVHLKSCRGEKQSGGYATSEE